MIFPKRDWILLFSVSFLCMGVMAYGICQFKKDTVCVSWIKVADRPDNLPPPTFGLLSKYEQMRMVQEQTLAPCPYNTDLSRPGWKRVDLGFVTGVTQGTSYRSMGRTYVVIFDSVESCLWMKEDVSKRAWWANFYSWFNGEK